MKYLGPCDKEGKGQVKFLSAAACVADVWEQTAVRMSALIEHSYFINFSYIKQIKQNDLDYVKFVDI